MLRVIFLLALYFYFVNAQYFISLPRLIVLYRIEMCYFMSIN